MTRVTAFTLVFALALCAFCATSPAMAQTKLDKVLNRGYLIVGTGSTNPPWHFKNKKGELVGFDIAISRIIAAGLFNDPSKVRFVVQSSAARIPNLLTNKVDITCQFMTVTPQRAQLVAFTIPYYREGVGLMMLKSSKYDNYQELKAAGGEVTVAVLQNVYATEMVHEVLPKAQVAQYKSQNLVYQALNAKRADAVATDISSMRWFMSKNPGRYIASGKTWNAQSYSCAVSQGQPVWLHYINTVLREAMTGITFPKYAKAFERYFGRRPPEPEVGFPTEYR